MGVAMETGLYGMRSGNRDFSTEKAWGKNIFTNSFPVALACYMADFDIPPVLLSSELSGAGRIEIRQELTPLKEIFQVETDQAKFFFETSFAPHSSFTAQVPEKSDLVVADSDSTPRSAFEIKLTTVPDNTTARKDHDFQSCEMVLRSLMIEQLAISICASYGKSGRASLNSLLNASLSSPNQIPWTDEKAMLSRLPEVLRAVEQVIKAGIDLQLPMVLHPIWRTVGQSPVLEDDCFDLFVWTNMALATMILDGSQPKPKGSRITRPQRSLIWLAKMLWDYSAQGTLDKADTFKTISYNTQTDKAASFSGQVTFRYLKGKQLAKPRVKARALDEIILGGGAKYLAPERRLDNSIFLQLVKDGISPQRL